MRAKRYARKEGPFRSRPSLLLALLGAVAVCSPRPQGAPPAFPGGDGGGSASTDEAGRPADDGEHPDGEPTPAASAAASAAPAVSASAAIPAASASAAPVASAGGIGEMATLAFEGGQAAYYAPGGSEARPLTVFLHGMCATGALECPVFAEAGRSGWLLCPDGGVACNGGGWMWAAQVNVAEGRLASAEGALRARHGARVADGPRAMVGYSLGAPAALFQVLREPGRYDRLMIVNASVEPAASQMKKAGVRRVALVAGARDATAGKLRAAAARLAAGGVEASFFPLENTGHYFDGQSQQRMAVPLAWLLAP